MCGINVHLDYPSCRLCARVAEYRPLDCHANLALDALARGIALRGLLTLVRVEHAVQRVKSRARAVVGVRLFSTVYSVLLS